MLDESGNKNVLASSNFPSNAERMNSLAASISLSAPEEDDLFLLLQAHKKQSRNKKPVKFLFIPAK